MVDLKTLLLSLVTLASFGKGYSQTKELYETIVKLDSIFFAAYNNCDIEKQTEFYSDSIEFYHDQAGLTTSKKQILESTRK